MKKHGILNSHIAKVLADLGHTDQIVIADCGLPVPNGVPKIDLALKMGRPSFLEVYEEVTKDMAVEKIILASEIKDQNQAIHEKLQAYHEAIDYVSHEDFKALTKEAKVIIRTGEASPFANVILQSNVIF